MDIGTVRESEARVFDSREGFHSFWGEDSTDLYGSFEVFWVDASVSPQFQDEDEMPPGWYWWACFPGCLPDGDPVGPFSSSIAAYYNAQSE